MKGKILLLLALLFVLSGYLVAQPIFITFREMADKQSVAATCSLVLQEAPEYPVGFVKTPVEERWLIQLYKDGGDGKINPLDKLGKPTGDDIMVTDSTHFNVSQGLYFAVPYVWMMSAFRFFAPGEEGEVWQGDKIYVRIFNNTSLDKADKYVVSHTLYTIPASNDVTSYVPDYGWDARGWISFRDK